jgi:hypothetical protein
MARPGRYPQELRERARQDGVRAPGRASLAVGGDHLHRASSGATHRHRLNRRGNRQLNAALHRIAVTQMRIHDPAKGLPGQEAIRGDEQDRGDQGAQTSPLQGGVQDHDMMDQPTDRLTAVAA